MIFERLLKMKQTFIHVGDPPKKPTTKDKTKSLNSQRVGPENGQPRVSRLKYLVMPSKMGKC
jgi:hypothetical protein